MYGEALCHLNHIFRQILQGIKIDVIRRYCDETFIPIHENKSRLGVVQHKARLPPSPDDLIDDSHTLTYVLGLIQTRPTSLSVKQQIEFLVNTQNADYLTLFLVDAHSAPFISTSSKTTSLMD